MKKKPKILIIDDEATSRMCTAHILGSAYDIFEAEGQASCFEHLKKNAIDLILLDIVMPKVSGLDLLKQLQEAHRHIPVVMLSSSTDIETVVEAMQRGGKDYVIKQTAKQLLRDKIESILAIQKKSQTIAGLVSELGEKLPEYFIPKNEKYERVFQLAVKAASKRLRILIEGESGTGKEIIVEHIRKECFKNAPIIRINCATIPETLAETELFGCEENAFTDAKFKRGKLELASGGILFLDEISTMPMGVQGKLLRALESQRITRLGGSVEISTDFFLVCATNESLKTAIQSGKFREDLYYRISDIFLQMPNLKNTPEVIRPFIQFFMAKAQKKYDENSALSPSLEQYFYSNIDGNLRSLKKAIYATVALGEVPDMTDKHTPITSRGDRSLSEYLTEIEKSAITSALEQHKNNVTLAAKSLGIKRTTLTEKIKKYV